jgi:outer membrane protein assembly factor BamB
VENLEPGLSLRQAVDRYGPLPEPSLRRLAEGMAQALTTIHAAGSVYGAVGPDSVLLAANGPYLIPSGTSVFGQSAGSPAHDMFGLGRTVLYAASGTEPALEGGTEDLPARIAEIETTTSVLPESLREVIGGCLYPDPSTRPTAGQLVDYLNQQGVPTPPSSWLPPELATTVAPSIPTTPSPSPDGVGLSRRHLLIGLAGGAVVVGGVSAAVLSFSSKTSLPNALGLTGGPAPTPPPSTPNASATTPTPPSDSPTKVPLDAPEAPKAWTVTGATAPTAIAASEKAILVVTDKDTTLVDAATGKRMFPSLNATISYAEPGQFPTTYANGIFYCICDTPNTFNNVAAIDATTGTVKWATTMADVEPGGSSDGPIWSATYLVASGNTVYVCGSVEDNNATSGSGPQTGFIRAFDAATGKATWHISGTDLSNVLIPPSGPYLLAASSAPPGPGQAEMIDTGRQGARGWKKPIAGTNPYYNSGWPMTCYAAGMFVFCDGDTAIAVDAATGTEKWRYTFHSENGDQVELGTMFASQDGTTVYAAVGSDLAAFNAADGALKWVAELTGPGKNGLGDLFNATLQISGYVAQCSADTILATDTSNTLWAIDAASGKARWKYTDPGQPDTGFMWRVGGDRVFVASNLTLTAIAIR